MPLVPAPWARRREADSKATLAFQIDHGLPGFLALAEYAFHPTRKWRFDLIVYPMGSTAMSTAAGRAFLGDRVVAVEIEGGLFLPNAGRHNRGAGMRADLDKYNEAVLLGWKVIRVLPEWVASGKAFSLVARAVKGSQ